MDGYEPTQEADAPVVRYGDKPWQTLPAEQAGQLLRAWASKRRAEFSAQLAAVLFPNDG